MPLQKLVLGHVLAIALIDAGLCQQAKAGDEVADPDTKLLNEKRIGTDSASLLSFLKERSQNDASLLRVDELIRQLGSASFQEREQASKKLIAVGPPAHAALRKAAGSSDAEIVGRAKTCMEQIEAAWHTELPHAVVRLLLRQPPPETVEALLRFLPYAADEELAEEIWFGLDNLVKREPTTSQAFEQVVEDRLSPRRALAAYMLSRRGNRAQQDAARKLLGDPEAMVRLRAAQGFLGAGDQTSIDVLILLLAEPAVEVGWQAEELLHWVAGDTAPDVNIGSASKETREACGKAWHQWWQNCKRRIGSAQQSARYRRPGLVLLWGIEEAPKEEKDASGVWLYGCDGKLRWRLAISSAIPDLQPLPGGSVLLTETSLYRPLDILRGRVTAPDRITERSLDGKILWQYKPSFAPYSCRRLANGKTIVGGRMGQMVELDWAGHEHAFPKLKDVSGQIGLLVRPRGLSDRRILAQTLSPAIVEIQADTGTVVRHIQLPDQPAFRDIASIQPLPNHGVLLSSRDGGVIEIDASGKKTWAYARQGCYKAVRLRDGNTLIAGGEPPFRSERLVELTKAGKVISEIFTKKVGPYGGEHFAMCPCFELLRLGFDGSQEDLATSMRYRYKSITSADPIVRYWSVYEARFLGREGFKQLGYIVAEALDDPDESIRRAAYDTLKAMGEDSFGYVFRAVGDGRARVREAAVKIMADLGSKDRILIIIKTLRRDEDPSVRCAAARALSKFEGAEAVSALVEALKDKSVLVRAEAAKSLSLIGSDAEVAVPALAAALKDDASVSHNAARALRRLGPKAEPALPALIDALASEDHRLRASALEAFGGIGPAANGAVRSILEAMKTDGVADKKVAAAIRKSAIWSLGQIGPAAKDAIPAITAALGDEDKEVRSEAAKALHKIQR